MKVCNHLETYLDSRTSTLDVMGMVVTRIDPFPAIISGMECAAGLIVMTVRFGSLADLAGISSGDIVCEIEGIPVRDILDLKNILSGHDPLKPLRMLFRRVGAWRYLALPLDEEAFWMS